MSNSTRTLDLTPFRDVPREARWLSWLQTAWEVAVFVLVAVPFTLALALFEPDSSGEGE